MAGLKKENTIIGFTLITIIALLFCFTARAQIITTVAGNGNQGYTGDGGQATNAALFNSIGVAVDAIGNIYFADGDNYRIRKVNTLGIITTIAGIGTMGYSGDNGPATNAQNKSSI